MKNHKLEIYLDSYSNQPLVADVNPAELKSRALDQRIKEWLSRETGRAVDIEKQLKIEDVGHPTVTRDQTATRLRVKLV